MASQLICKKNDASGFIFYVSLDPRTPTGTFQSNPTLAAGDVKISKDGGALANLGTLPAVTPASSKAVKVTLSQAETNADNLVIIFNDAAGAEWCDYMVNVRTVAVGYDELAVGATVGAALTAIDDYVDTEISTIISTLGTPVGASLSVDLAGVQSDTNDIQTRLPAALTGGGNIKADVLAISGGTTSADNLEASTTGIVVGAAIAGTLTVTAMSTNLTETTNDHYNGRTIIWTSGNLLGQASTVTDYDGASKVLTYDALTEAPTAADAFVLV